MSFFKTALGAGSILKKQVMPNLQGFFKKGGGGRQFSKMAGEAAGLIGVAGRELRLQAPAWCGQSDTGANREYDVRGGSDSPTTSGGAGA